MITENFDILQWPKCSEFNTDTQNRWT
jgi:hypothetical protein